jgi:hypothetical protein
MCVWVSPCPQLCGGAQLHTAGARHHLLAQQLPAGQRHGRHVGCHLGLLRLRQGVGFLSGGALLLSLTLTLTLTLNLTLTLTVAASHPFHRSRRRLLLLLLLLLLRRRR